MQLSPEGVRKMKKISATVIKETAFIAVWTLIFSVIIQAVFLIIGKWDISVLLGNILSYIAAVGNFFLMALTVQSAVEQDEKDASARMRLSQLLRTLALFGILIVGVLVPCFNVWSVMIPIFFPRIAVSLRPFFLKKDGTSENTDK